MTKDEKIQRYKDKIAANIEEAKRQSEYAGIRIGVFAQLRQLERQRQRFVREILKLDPDFSGPELFA